MTILAAFTIFDYGVIAVLVISALFSTLRGMTREFLGLTGWFVSIALSRVIAPYLEPTIDSFVPVEDLAEILSWALPFAGSVVVWYILASLISPGLKRAGLGVLDRWLGILFGIARGLVLITLLYSGTVMILKSEDKLPTAMSESASAPSIRYITSLFAPLLPAGLSDKLDGMRLPDSIELGQTTTEMIDKGTDAVEDTFSLKKDELQ
jgi:membrane protein required for colicin V production